MPAVRPTRDFAHVALVLTTLESGRMFGHVYFERHVDPLGYGKTPSRFSDPRRRMAANRFGVLYLRESLTAARPPLRGRRQREPSGSAQGLSQQAHARQPSRPRWPWASCRSTTCYVSCATPRHRRPAATKWQEPRLHIFTL